MQSAQCMQFPQGEDRRFERWTSDKRTRISPSRKIHDPRFLMKISSRNSIYPVNSYGDAIRCCRSLFLAAYRKVASAMSTRPTAAQRSNGLPCLRRIWTTSFQPGTMKSKCAPTFCLLKPDEPIGVGLALTNGGIKPEQASYAQHIVVEGMALTHMHISIQLDPEK